MQVSREVNFGNFALFGQFEKFEVSKNCVRYIGFFLREFDRDLTGSTKKCPLLQGVRCYSMSVINRFDRVMLLYIFATIRLLKQIILVT